MRLTNQLLTTIVAAAMVAALVPASAQAAPDNKTKARALFVDGSKKFAAGKYTEAIVVFKQAYVFWKNPKILLNIAICYAEDGDAVQAVTYLRKAMSSADAETVAKLKASVPAGLKKKEQEVAVLKVVMPDPAAEIFLDDQPMGRSPAERVLTPGDYKVEVKLNGVLKVTKTITLTAGARETFALQSWPDPVKVKPPEPLGQPGPKKSWRRFAKLPMYYFGAAALVTLIGTVALIGTGVTTESIKDDYYAAPSLSTRDKGISYRTATNVLIGITVTAGVATAVMGVLFTDWRWPPWKKREKASTTRLTPGVGPGGASLTLSGSF